MNRKKTPGVNVDGGWPAVRNRRNPMRIPTTTRRHDSGNIVCSFGVIWKPSLTKNDWIVERTFGIEMQLSFVFNHFLIFLTYNLSTSTHVKVISNEIQKVKHQSFSHNEDFEVIISSEWKLYLTSCVFLVINS